MTRDRYLDAVRSQWGAIVGAYEIWESKRPIVLFDISEGKIYVHSHDGFRADLSSAGQASLDTQYELAEREGQIVIFVRDNDRRKLVSYSLDR
jgi:hypothetical protein